MTFTTRGPIVDVEQVRTLSQLDEKALATKQVRDQELAAILRGEDKRILLVIGPCSSDNEEAVLEYAKRLAALQEEVKKQSEYKGLLEELERGKEEIISLWEHLEALSNMREENIIEKDSIEKDRR